MVDARGNVRDGEWKMFFYLVRKLLAKVHACMPCSAFLSRDSRGVEPVKACSRKFVTAKIAWTPWLRRGGSEIHCIYPHFPRTRRGHSRQTNIRHLRKETNSITGRVCAVYWPFQWLHTHTSKAFNSDPSSSIFAETSSTPCFSSGLAASLEVSRVDTADLPQLCLSAKPEPRSRLARPVALKTAIVF